MQTEIESQFDRMSHVRTYQKTYWQKRKFFTPAWFHISVRTKRYIWMDAAYATCQFQKISGSNKAHTLYGFKLHREIPFLFFLLLSFLYFLGPFLFHLVFFSLFIFFYVSPSCTWRWTHVPVLLYLKPPPRQLYFLLSCLFRALHALATPLASVTFFLNQTPPTLFPI